MKATKAKLQEALKYAVAEIEMFYTEAKEGNLRTRHRKEFVISIGQFRRLAELKKLAA